MKDIDLIAFDLDGVLVSGRGSWMEVHFALGTQRQAGENSGAYLSGGITFDEWARRDAGLWDGVEYAKIKEVLDSLPYTTGAPETLKALKEMGYTIAIISGGLKPLADRVRDSFNLDYSIGNDFILKDGKIRGIKKDVDFTGKGEALKNIAQAEGITTRQCACIGDYLNDIPMFKLAGYSIAFNPKDEELVKYANHVIREENLEKILPLFTPRECTLPQ